MAPKQIVKPTDIVNDPCLVLIKAFRIANKRAGEVKRESITLSNADVPDEAAIEAKVQEYEDFCAKIRGLASQAETDHNFKIWVNVDTGRTGHTYDKDYKITQAVDNNYQRHLSTLEHLEAAVSDAISRVPDDRISSNSGLIPDRDPTPEDTDSPSTKFDVDD